MSDELSTFFYELQRQLNPTIFTTDWVGHRLMHVDFAMIDGDLATVKTCFEEMDLILRERGFPITVLEQIVDLHAVSEEMKDTFWNAWRVKGELCQVHFGSHLNLSPNNAFVFFVVECFTRLVFRYTL